MTEGSPKGDAASVSVVIPAYNYARYLKGTIESALGQTFGDFELLMIDDGSTDETKDLLASVNDPRVRYIWQTNQGLSAARNRGIMEARHSFVAFLDADDLWHPEFLESVMREYSRLNAEFALLATATSRIDENGHSLPPNRHAAGYEAWSGEVTAADFCLRNQPLSSSVVIRRSAFHTSGMFDTTLRSSEDRDMWIRIASQHRCWILNRALASIRKHGSSMSRNAPRMEQSARRVLAKAWRSNAVARTHLPFWLQAASVHCLVSAWTHFHQRYHTRAFALLSLSVLFWPVFPKPGRIREPSFFRLRSLLHFFRAVLANRY